MARSVDAFVSEHLAGVSRTYAIVIPMLPPGLDEAVGLAYLLMRIVDTLEDAPELSGDERARLFEHLEAALADEHGTAVAELTRPIGESPAEHALMQDAPEVLARISRLAPAYREAIRACARRMIGGVREFSGLSALRGQAYPAIGDIAELRLYCYYVAGVVGEMLCAMMAHYLGRPAFLRQRDAAVQLGTGLQLVNILKDCRKDAGQGRRYLPTSAGRGDSPGEVYRQVLEEARRSLARGIEYVLALPAEAVGVRAFCGLPLVWGALTLGQAERDPSAARIGRETIQSSIARFRQLATDDHALRHWLGQMLRQPKLTPTT